MTDEKNQESEMASKNIFQEEGKNKLHLTSLIVGEEGCDLVFVLDTTGTPIQI